MHDLARQAAETLLHDTVRLIDAKKVGTTSRITFQVAVEADAILWEGPAMVVTASYGSRTTEEASGDTQRDEVTLRTPLEAPDVKPGTIVLVVDAEDLNLIGEVFEVNRSAGRSNSILRRYVLVRRVPHSSIATA